ncbi:MAG: diacylglycerol kinase family lipid kinase [Candidatus Marinimicrobia bacterium]|jgi:diacylglycerol kinase (ATP)|nr:diacylglycerol kinase family lipid kinase [Candidatus Neomarinimicrobiota bacterium]MBT4362627.1 diacylglycerol kinase family lipid kinase [Candidatus Neomarinimicrobiota bacterium]MBT4713442.1 diacylglycerol kinase family lipid kinase [Candidatus Neomarinimicrobiota bacterium]MBT4944612.1 diacylglycerol kinase family lipid kinase [Candidatus Neomarinimicrobiota bacterium]MBT5270674.1 diacylglycerol kinase family lipid kinase [Candidatus Neomarinimicrobiota bacterium]
MPEPISNHRYLLIVNPEAGSRSTMKALPEIERIMRERKAEYEFHFTKEKGHATELVKEVGADFDVVVSVGGDGTINEILNGMPDLNKPMGIIPIGTGNDFARSCSIKLGDLESAVDVLLAHDVKNLDVGEVNGRRFINVMGLGFGGKANDIAKKLSFLKGSFKYLIAIAGNYLTYRRMHLTVRFNDFERNEKVFLMSIGNGWNEGGGLQLTPKAILHDGLFDVCYVQDISRWRILQIFTKLYDGTADEAPEMELHHTTELYISSEIPVPAHMDGESFSPVQKEFKIRLIPQAQEIIGNWSADARFN